MPAKEVGFEIPSFQSFNFVGMQPKEKRKLAFLQAIPGKDNPITVMKRHYFAEEQNGSKYVMCTGGLCCQYETWDNFSKSYHPQKSKTVYWVPCVYYYSDPDTLLPKASVGIIAFNYFQFTRYIEQVNSTKPSIDEFFKQDITVSFDKNGQYGDYAFIKEGGTALYLTNPQMKADVEDQLKTFAQAIKDALPPEYTEIQMAAKIEEWNKVKAAKAIQTEEAIATPQSMDPALVAQPAQQLQQPQAIVTQTVAQSQVQPQVVVQPQVTEINTATNSVVQPAQPVQTTQAISPEQVTQANPVSNDNYTLEDLASVLQSVQE